jgi:hypothetical protein
MGVCKEKRLELRRLKQDLAAVVADGDMTNVSALTVGGMMQRLIF